METQSKSTTQEAMRLGLANAIDRIATLRGLSVRGLARSAGVSGFTTSNLLKGLNDVRLSTIWKLGNALGYDVRVIFIARRETHRG